MASGPQVMPILEALRPGSVERIGEFARLAADDDALLDRLAATELSRRVTEDGGVDWRDPPEAALGRRILRLAIGHPAPSAERVEALLDAAAGDRGGVTHRAGWGTDRDRQGQAGTHRALSAPIDRLRCGLEAVSGAVSSICRMMPSAYRARRRPPRSVPAEISAHKIGAQARRTGSAHRIGARIGAQRGAG